MSTRYFWDFADETTPAEAFDFGESSAVYASEKFAHDDTNNEDFRIAAALDTSYHYIEATVDGVTGGATPNESVSLCVRVDTTQGTPSYTNVERFECIVETDGTATIYEVTTGASFTSRDASSSGEFTDGDVVRALSTAAGIEFWNVTTGTLMASYATTSMNDQVGAGIGTWRGTGGNGTATVDNVSLGDRPTFVDFGTAYIENGGPAAGASENVPVPDDTGADSTWAFYVFATWYQYDEDLTGHTRSTVTGFDLVAEHDYYDSASGEYNWVGVFRKEWDGTEGANFTYTQSADEPSAYTTLVAAIVANDGGVSIATPTTADSPSTDSSEPVPAFTTTGVNQLGVYVASVFQDSFSTSITNWTNEGSWDGDYLGVWSQDVGDAEAIGGETHSFSGNTQSAAVVFSIAEIDTMQATHLDTGFDTDTDAATGSVSPTSGARLYAFVTSHHDDEDACTAEWTVSGLSGTWSLVPRTNTIVNASVGAGLMVGLYVCDDWSGSGAITATYAGADSTGIDETTINVCEVTGLSDDVAHIGVTMSLDGYTDVVANEAPQQFTIGSETAEAVPTNGATLAWWAHGDNGLTTLNNTAQYDDANWVVLGAIDEQAANNRMFALFYSSGGDTTLTPVGANCYGSSVCVGLILVNDGDEPTSWAVPAETLDTNVEADGTTVASLTGWSAYQVTGSGVLTTDNHSGHGPTTRMLDASTTGEQRAVSSTQCGSDDHGVALVWFFDKDTANAVDNTATIYLRLQDGTAGADDDGYAIRFFKEPTAGNQITSIVIYEMTNGSLTSLASYTTNISTGSQESGVNLYATIVGDDITVYVNGTEYLTHNIDGDATEYNTGEYWGFGHYREKGLTDSQPFVYRPQAVTFDGAGGGGLEEELTDDLGMTDTVVAELTSPTAYCDTWDGGDSSTQGSDTWDGGDSSTQGSDTWDGGDSSTPLCEAIEDDLGLTDTVTAGKDADTAVTDDLGLTDTVEAGKDADQTVADDLGLTDTVAAGKDADQTVQDDLGLSDTVEAGKDIEVTVADTLGLSDTLDRVVDADRTVTDDLGLTDQVADELSGADAETISDTLGLSDTVDRVVDADRTVADDLGLTDTVAAGKDADRTVEDDLGLSDTVEAGKNADQTVSDTLGLSDTVEAGKAIVVEITDDLGATDTLDRVVDADRTVTDDLGATDTVVDDLSGEGTETITDTLGLSDTVDRVVDADRTVADDLGLTDTVDAGKDADRTVEDDLGLTDTVEAGKAIVVEISDTLGATDNLDALSGIVVEISDTLGATDTLDRDATFDRTLTDDLGLLDDIEHDGSSGGDSPTPTGPLTTTLVEAPIRRTSRVTTHTRRTRPQRP